MKAMKAMKAMKVSARMSAKTAAGLAEGWLVKKKRGKIVNKRRSELAKKSPWMSAAGFGCWTQRQPAHFSSIGSQAWHYARQALTGELSD